MCRSGIGDRMADGVAAKLRQLKVSQSVIDSINAEVESMMVSTKPLTAV